MKNMKRALRRHQKHSKFVKRVKHRAAFNEGWLFINKTTGEKITVNNPSWKDLEQSNDGYIFKLKTISTVCSCDMCSCDKYSRKEQKKINKSIIDEEFLD